MRKEFFYDSKGAGRLHACVWVPDREPQAVVQIVHGITEHIERYDQFARYLNQKGFLVVAEDHMGHGRSVEQGGTKGYFDGGWDTAVEDTCHLLRMTKGRFPELPYILLGQSMGSFMVRTILCKYPEIGISGAVICGTGWMPEAVVQAGKATAAAVCRAIGETKPSRLLHSMMFAGYNRRVERVRTSHDWLTRDAVIVDAYLADPMCGFASSSGLVRDMMGGILYIQNREHLKNMRADMPVLFIAGGDDPVGNYGEGVRKTAEEFRNAGMTDVTVKIYPLCRHEMLNEINRAEVFRTINIWIRENFL